MMNIGLVGGGPATLAFRAALSDVEATVTDRTVDDLDDVDLVIVVGRSGDTGFDRANETCLERSMPWMALEVGGIGGDPIEDVAACATGFGSTGPCFHCLRTRIRSAEIAVAEHARADPTMVRLAGAIAGQAVAAVTRSGNPDDELAGRVVELPYRERRLLGVPGCKRCGTRPSTTGTFESEPERSDLDRTIERAEAAIDPRVGIVSEIGEVESFPAPYYRSRSASTSPFSDVEAPRDAAGVAEDWDVAFMKAIGEALERYAAGVYRSGDFTVASPQAMDPVIDLASMSRPTQPAGDEPIPWVMGTRLPDDRTVAVPAELVYFPPPERRFGPAITTGLGLDTSWPGAVCSGLYEVVERDATMIGWYSTFEPVGLTVEDETYDRLVRRAAGEGLSVATVSLTQDVDVPVVVSSVYRTEAFPHFAAGSAANLDPVAAARKALEEALQNWMELVSMGPEQADAAGGWIGRYAKRPDPPAKLVDSPSTIPATHLNPTVPGSEPEALDRLVEVVTEASLTPTVARVTTRDLEDLGFEAVRVVVPEAQPLFTTSPFFAERARTVPATLGFEPAQDRPPHPFP